MQCTVATYFLQIALYCLICSLADRACLPPAHHKQMKNWDFTKKYTKGLVRSWKRVQQRFGLH